MGLKFLHLHLHGLIRSNNLELGRDSDTGGQTQYVLELVKSLANNPEVDQVDLVTRLISDTRVDNIYSQPTEFLDPGAKILRFQCGPNKYLRKELLWPHLEELTQNLIHHYRKLENKPDWIHAHYADAGYVGSRLSKALGIPLIFTGHSLGREKKRKMLDAGLKLQHIEKLYFISKRISAEEETLKHANVVVTSTKQESVFQYSQYNNYSYHNSRVIAPGVDHNKFHHIHSTTETSEVESMMIPFLRDTTKPPLLTISRAVRRKNIPSLVEAYGRSEKLKRKANLILILGCRDNTSKLESQQRDVFQKIFEMIDKYNLYGKVAYPKKHTPETIPALYRWAASKGGLFVNPALTEPFGLTLLEASSCGLPIISTDDGGPKEIQSKCENGMLVDVTDINKLKVALEKGITIGSKWKSWSRNGIEGVHRHFSWSSHVRSYLSVLRNESEKANFISHPLVSSRVA